MSLPALDRDRVGRFVATLLAGGGLGIGVEVGGALLLYSGLGLLSAAGFILGVALAALAAGVWVGTSDEHDDGDGAARSAVPWMVAVGALAIAAAFAFNWEHSQKLRAMPAGRAVALLLLVAWPAYSLASLLGTLDRRTRLAAPRPAEHAGGVAALALLGAAAAVAWGGLILIPRLPASYVLGGWALALAIAGTWESRRRFDSAERSAPMRGKVAIVTGVGSRGQVGYTVAEALLRAGARVLVTGRSAGVEALAKELGAGGEVFGVAADLSHEAGATSVVDAVREHFGRLDALVNVAGGLSVIKPLAETDEAEWARELDRNARTTFLMCRAALPLLRDGAGAIVNFASPAGVRARASLGAYSAAKAAVVALTRSLALEEAAHGVRVNAVAPGMVDTEQNRASAPDDDRAGWVTREEVADVVLFLLSGAAAGVTGETIQVPGAGIR